MHDGRACPDGARLAFVGILPGSHVDISARARGGGGDGGSTGAESRSSYLEMYAQRKPDKVRHCWPPTVDHTSWRHDGMLLVSLVNTRVSDLPGPAGQPRRGEAGALDNVQAVRRTLVSSSMRRRDGQPLQQERCCGGAHLKVSATFSGTYQQPEAPHRPQAGAQLAKYEGGSMF